MTKFATKEDEWRAYLTGTHPTLRWGHRTFRFVPYGPRCKMCSAPFHGPGKFLLGHFGFRPWDKHPGICTRCITLLEDQEVSGAEVEISFLFADVRRSSDLARSVIERAGSDSDVALVPYEEAYGEGFEELGRRRPDTSAVRELIGWEPERDLDEAIDDIVASTFEPVRPMV